MIPKKLHVGKRLYTVTLTPDKPPNGSTFARANVSFASQTITIRTTAMRSRRLVSMAVLQHAFWHELTHAILHDMGSKLAYDETFVTRFSNRLDKAIRTARF